MQGLWKNKLGGWDKKDCKRKSQNFNKYRKENAKYEIRNSERTNSKYIRRTNNKDYDYGLDDCDTMLFNKPFQDWEYYTVGLDGTGGSKHRKIAIKDIRGIERTAVNNYIQHEDWDKVLDYHGMKKTVLWDIT